MVVTDVSSLLLPLKVRLLRVYKKAKMRDTRRNDMTPTYHLALSKHVKKRQVKDVLHRGIKKWHLYFYVQSGYLQRQHALPFSRLLC